MGTTSFDFTGQSVVVTGATTGIGAAVAEAFRSTGAHVVITGTKPAPEYDESFDGFEFRQMSLGDPDSIKRLAANVAECDVLVNNAGGMIRTPSEMTLAGFTESIDANLTGTFAMCEAFHPHLARRHGAVINLASTAAIFPSPRVPAYSAAKAGLITLSASLAQAWAADGIRVNAVIPGWIETRMTAGHVADPGRSEPILARTPAGRWGTPDDMVGPILFLASDQARYMTGAAIPVDGGYHVT